MRKTNLLKVTIATLALSMIVAAPMATFNVSANDGKGIYAEKNATITDLDRDAIVTASSANVREGISTAYRVLNVFEKGTKFHIDGVACKDGEQTNWYRVIVTDKQYGGECAGYINKSTFEFTDGQDEDLRDLFDTIYSAQPGTAGGSEKTSEAAEEFRAFVFDRDEEVTEGEIAYAAQLFLSEKDADYVANFKEAFEAVREANLEEDEAIEEDVEYIKFVNGINDGIEKAMEKEDKEDKEDKDQKEVKCEYKVEKMNKTMKAAHDVYVRKGPKKEFEKLGAYAKGAEVKVTGQVYKHGNKACWVQVSYKGETGYVCTDYLK